MLFDEEAEDRRHPPPSILARVVLGIVLTVLAVLVLLIVLGAWVAHEVSTLDDGDGYAQELVERTAIGIADDVEGHYAAPADAETFAQRAIEDPRLADGQDAEYRFQVLGWEGSSADRDGARFELAISVDGPEWSQGAMFGDTRTAGSATSCWHFVVRAHEYDDTADLGQIDCPDDVVAATPDPSAPPTLGPDAEATVVDVMNRLPVAVDPTSAEAALRYEFPSSVDVSVVWEGKELVAAVGLAEARDCIVAVRHLGSTTLFSDFDRILLEPGELGCVPTLYTAPVTTH